MNVLFIVVSITVTLIALILAYAYGGAQGDTAASELGHFKAIGICIGAGALAGCIVNLVWWVTEALVAAAYSHLQNLT